MKVGDKVFIDGGYRKSVGVIDHETATQWVIGHQRFRKSDGLLIGQSDRYISTHISELTQQDIDNFKHARLANTLKTTDFSKQSLETLEAIKELLK